jgi:hypothetical protein
MSDRRFTPRFNLKIPFVFCPMNTPVERGYPAKSINISERGVYFKTEQRVSVGLHVRVLLQMPSQCRGNLATSVVFTGRVTHVATKRRRYRSLGVGVEFIYSDMCDC